VDEVRDALKEMKSDMLSKITDIREDITKIDKYKAGVDATNEALVQKADAHLVEQVLLTKANKEELEVIVKQLEDLKGLKQDKDKWESA